MAHFYANQKQIEKEHCVNKSQPEKACHGKCYLKTQLEKTDLVNNVQTPERLQISGMLFFQFHELPQKLSIGIDQTKNTAIIAGITDIHSGFSSLSLPPPQAA